MAIRVAIDAMGGDHAPRNIIEGAINALQKSGTGLEIVLCGRENLINQELNRIGAGTALPIAVHNADDVIGMGESPTSAVKSKRNSSIHVGLGLHKAGKVNAFASAGNTGAVMAASLFILGRLPGVSRPSVLGYYPTLKGHSILLDVGTNMDCKPEHLLQFALMGSVYLERIEKRSNPVIGLLNIGEESSKGNELTKAAYKLLDASPHLNFAGNLEGRDILYHAADVIICDGFVGNVILKLGESIASALPVMIGREMKAQSVSGDIQTSVVKIFDNVKKPFNYEEYGGAPLLGVAGNVIIGHGSSSPRAVERMILVAKEMAEAEVAHSISEAINP